MAYGQLIFWVTKLSSPEACVVNMSSYREDESPGSGEEVIGHIMLLWRKGEHETAISYDGLNAHAFWHCGHLAMFTGLPDVFKDVIPLFRWGSFTDVEHTHSNFEYFYLFAAFQCFIGICQSGIIKTNRQTNTTPLAIPGMSFWSILSHLQAASCIGATIYLATLMLMLAIILVPSPAKSLLHMHQALLCSPHHPSILPSPLTHLQAVSCNDISIYTAALRP